VLKGTVFFYCNIFVLLRSGGEPDLFAYWRSEKRGNGLPRT